MKKPLYIHFHIPKTAGYTFRYHVQKNLKKDQHLLLDYEFIGLDMFKPPLNYQIYKYNAFKLIKSLSKEKRDKLKIIHGHTVPYGIHELFDREARYFTFIRNPLDRTVSIYLHFVKWFHRDGMEKRKYPYYLKYLLVNGKVPTFYKWLKRKYKKDTFFTHFSMSGYLKEFGYLNGKANSKAEIRNALNKFFFLGKTENFNQESLYFYDKLGMHKFFIDQNISGKKSDQNIHDLISKNMISRNRNDNYLYKQGELRNIKFKENNADYIKQIKLKEMERKLLLPITQPVFAPRKTIIRLFKMLTVKIPIKADPLYYSKKLKF